MNAQALCKIGGSETSVERATASAVPHGQTTVTGSILQLLLVASIASAALCQCGEVPQTKQNRFQPRGNEWIPIETYRNVERRKLLEKRNPPHSLK